MFILNYASAIQVILLLSSRYISRKIFYIRLMDQKDINILRNWNLSQRCTSCISFPRKFSYINIVNYKLRFQKSNRSQIRLFDQVSGRQCKQIFWYSYKASNRQPKKSLIIVHFLSSCRTKPTIKSIQSSIKVSKLLILSM